MSFRQEMKRFVIELGMFLIILLFQQHNYWIILFIQCRSGRHFTLFINHQLRMKKRKQNLFHYTSKQKNYSNTSHDK